MIIVQIRNHMELLTRLPVVILISARYFLYYHKYLVKNGNFSFPL
jgi:hypothetical protein